MIASTKNKHMVKASILSQRKTHFSWLNTRLALERTLMSWVRTGSALIGFGFTIFQFFDRLNHMEGVAPPQNPATSRLVSLALIGIGTLGLILAIIEYRGMVYYLWSEEYRDIAGMGDKPTWTPLTLTASLVALVGFVTFIALFRRTVSL